MSESEDHFPNKEYKGQKFDRADMTDAIFNGVDLSNSRFWAVMENGTFRDSNLRKAVFDDVNLEQSTFENVNLSRSQYNNVNLSDASFANLNLSNTEVRDAKLDGMKINGVLVTDLFDAWRNSQ